MHHGITRTRMDKSGKNVILLEIPAEESDKVGTPRCDVHHGITRTRMDKSGKNVILEIPAEESDKVGTPLTPEDNLPISKSETFVWFYARCCLASFLNGLYMAR